MNEATHSVSWDHVFHVRVGVVFVLHLRREAIHQTPIGPVLGMDTVTHFPLHPAKILIEQNLTQR